MPNPTAVGVKRAFRGLVTNPAAEHVSPAHATDILNVHTANGSIQRRQGYDLINATSVKALAFVDRFDRSNGDPNNNAPGFGTQISITGATQANPVVITTSAEHSLTTGQIVRIDLVAGMTEINNRAFTITVVTTTTFNLDNEDGTEHTAHSGSAGRALACDPAQAGVDVTWGGLEEMDAAKNAPPHIWNQTLRGNPNGTGISGANSEKLSSAVLLNAAGTASPFSGAHYAVEFLLRKYQGFADANDRDGSTRDNVFVANQDAFADDCEFSVDLRAKNLFGYKRETYTTDDAYEVVFTVPCGTSVEGSHSATNTMRWDDLKIDVYKRLNGGRGSTVATSAGAGAAPGCDEWIHVKIQIYATGTSTRIRVFIDSSGTPVIDYNDNSGSAYDGAGYMRFHWQNAVSGVDFRETLRRQVQIAGLVGYNTDSAGVTSESGKRVNVLARHTQPDGDAFLLARTEEQLFVRNSGALDFVRNTAARLNRRAGLSGSSGSNAVIEYSTGDEFFTIIDTNTAGKDLTNDYTFTAGDRLHLMAAHQSDESGGATGDADDIITGLYEIDSHPEKSLLRVKGIPVSPVASLPTSSQVIVAYRILSKNSSDGIMGIVSDRTAGRGDSALANAMTYFADGSDRLVKSDGEAAHQVGIKGPMVKPAVPVLLNLGAKLDTSGDYHYKFTFYNEVLGIESSASPESVARSVTAGSNQGFKIDIAGNQSDLMATHVRLYRSTDAGATYVLSRTLPLPIDTYFGSWFLYDDVADSDLSSTAPPGATDNDVPPKATIIETHQERMWYSGEKGALADATKVFYSNVGTPDAVKPTNFLRLGSSDGESVNALVSLRNRQLIVLKDRSLWVIVGDTPSSFNVSRMAAAGCSGPQSAIVASDGLLYFAGERGIFRWDGQFMQELTFAILDTWLGQNLSRLNTVAIADDVQDRLLLISYTQSGNAENDRILVLPYLKPPVEDENGRLLFDWSIWDIAVTSWALDPESGVQKLRFGTSGGQVGTYRGDGGAIEKDNGTGYAWKWTGPKLDLGSDRLKRWRHLSVTFDKQTVPSMIKAGFLADDETSASTDSFDQSVKVGRYVRRVARRTKYLRPHFEASASTVVTRIVGYEVAGNPTGWL